MVVRNTFKLKSSTPMASVTYSAKAHCVNVDISRSNLRVARAQKPTRVRVLHFHRNLEITAKGWIVARVSSLAERTNSLWFFPCPCTLQEKTACGQFTFTESFTHGSCRDRARRTGWLPLGKSRKLRVTDVLSSAASKCLKRKKTKRHQKSLWKTAAL